MLFPQELIDLIIDSVRESDDAGPESSLVSWAWVSRNRRHTFRDIEIHLEDLHIFSELVAGAPEIRTCIRNLELICGNPDLTHLAVFDAPLTKVTSLTLVLDNGMAYDEEDEKLHEFNTAIMGIFSPITFPRLADLCIDFEILDAEIVYRVLNAFSHSLQCVSILGATMVTDGSAEMPIIRLPQLREWLFEVHEGVDYILKCLHPPTLPHQVMAVLGYYEPLSTVRFLEADVEMLSILAFELPLALVPTRLRGLTIYALSSDDEDLWATVLTNERLNDVSDIRLMFDSEMEDFPWAALDSILEPPRFEHLSNLGVCHPPKHTPDLAAKIRRAMPIAESRGILQFWTFDRDT
ncbi:hypothetical protein C8R47DRAFT_1108860, partial [Mycena vitilis]